MSEPKGYRPGRHAWYEVCWLPKPPIHPEYRLPSGPLKIQRSPWSGHARIKPDLSKKSTRVLLIWLAEARLGGTSNGVTFDELKAVLATREHVPPPRELRQRKAFEKRHR